jgi:hypothetical protein
MTQLTISTLFGSRREKIEIKIQKLINVFRLILHYLNVYSLIPSQNISKNESNKFDVFDSKFGQNTFIFVDQLLLILSKKRS